MKKIILSLLLLTGLAGYCCDYTCPESKDITSSTSRFLSTVTGQKSLSQSIGNKLIQNALKQNVKSGTIRTNLQSFSTRDLKAGKFKSIEITGKDVNIEDVYVTYFHVKTLCDYNYIAFDKKGNITIKEDIPLAIEVNFSAEDLNKTMESGDYKRIIDDINSLFDGVNLFHIDSTSAKIKHNKFYYIVKYYIPMVKGTKTVVFVSDLSANDGKIEFENTKILGETKSINVKYFSKIINYVNPLDFSLEIQENKNAKINIKNVKIVDDKIIADGIIIIPKDKE